MLNGSYALQDVWLRICMRTGEWTSGISWLTASLFQLQLGKKKHVKMALKPLRQSQDWKWSSLKFKQLWAWAMFLLAWILPLELFLTLFSCMNVFRQDLIRQLSTLQKSHQWPELMNVKSRWHLILSMTAESSMVMNAHTIHFKSSCSYLMALSLPLVRTLVPKHLPRCLSLSGCNVELSMAKK